jgi:hypothetical protein
MRMAMGMEVDSLRHAAQPRVRGRQFASGRAAALPGGDEALGGLERLPLTRGKEGDPRASFSARSSNPLPCPPHRLRVSGDVPRWRDASLRASATHLPSGGFLDGCFRDRP